MVIKRYTIIDYPSDNKTTGLYKGKRPIQAAKKALSRLTRDLDHHNNKGNHNKLLVFEMKCLDDDNIFKFIGTRIKLNKPKKVNLGGKTITYNFKNLVSYYDDYVKKNMTN